MDDLFEFVYCIDKKYNKQAFLSISSLIEHSNGVKLKINLIHKSPNSFNKYKRIINKTYPEIDLNIVKFKFNIKGYPKLKNAHVSEATYYRIFIGDHIKTSSNFIIYIDADAYIVNSPFIQIKESIDNMSKKNILLGAKTTDYFSMQQSLDIFERLDINDKYFNAGVLVINLKKWNEESISSKLQQQVKKIENEIVYWDQDVLNSFINGDYYEISNELNHIVNLNLKESFDANRVKIIHYVGGLKPWDKKGKEADPNTYYQSLNKKYLT
jgi:lipopolysaccharide biosynthesis glycosyltransferase